MEITGIILAGGKSKRMGTDKALLQFAGSTLIENAINILKPFCNSILISSNNTDHEKFGFPVILDEFSDSGPIGGIYSTLYKSNTDWNFVLSVDCPFVTVELIKLLISQNDSAGAIIPKHDLGSEPLIAFYNKRSLPVMKQSISEGDFKMQNLLQKLDPIFVNVQDYVERFPDLFKNLNTPEDLKR